MNGDGGDGEDGEEDVVLPCGGVGHGTEQVPQLGWIFF